ncbi:hypothetical protein BH24BAC1_BH24BAC1_15210 [soil metagenome]
MTPVQVSDSSVKPLVGGNKLAENSKLFLAIFAICTLLHLALAWSSRLYPHIDLPFHLAAATIYKYYGSQANDFSQFFYMDVFLRPNTFHLFFTSLEVFPSVEFGNKVFYAGYLLLFPLSVLLLIKQIGGNQWFALFSFLLIYNFNLNWGFVGFNIAIPFVLLLIYFVFRSLEGGSKWNKVVVAALLIVIYFMHALATIFSLILVVVIYGFCYRRSWKRLALTGLMVVPIIALLAYWWSTSQSDADTVGFLVGYYSHQFWTQYKLRIFNFFCTENFYLLEGGWGWAAGAFFTFLMHMPLAFWVLTHFKKLPEYVNWAKYGKLYLFILVSLGVYFLSPYGLPDQHYLYQRFGIFVHLGFILLSSLLVGTQHFPKVLTLAGIAFVLHFGGYAQRQLAFEKDTAGFTPDFLPSDVKGKKFAGIMLDRSFRGRLIYGHFPNYQIIWHQGVTATKAVEFRFGNVRRKVGEDKLPRFHDNFDSLTGKIRNPYSGLIDYIFIRGEVGAEGRELEMSDYNLIKTAGEWSLWKKK